MTPSENCIALTKSMEGLRLKAYQDSGGIITIGFGHTGEEAQPDNIITEAEAENLLTQDLQDAANLVDSLDCEFTQNQFDALCDLVFNMGLKRLQDRYPTFLHNIVTNPYNFDVICKMWLGVGVHDAKGNVLMDLEHRRLLESNLYKK